MANLNFPTSPANNDTFEANGRLWVWDSTLNAWVATSIGEVNLAGITFEGDWNSGTTYNTGDAVQYSGSVWIATQPSTNQTPADPSDYWDEMLGSPDISTKADKSNVLELDNTTEFTPDADYEPATKKYVDDNIPDVSGLVEGPLSSTINNVVLFNATDGTEIKDSGLTIQTSVPSGALFTDTTYTAGTGLTLTGTQFSLSGDSFSTSGSYANVAVGQIIESNASSNQNVWVGTQAQYDALVVKDTNTIFFITG